MESKEDLYKKLYSYCESLPGVINTHCHHIANQDNEKTTSLHQILQMTYISWMYPYFTDTRDQREIYIRTMASNSYFRWMAKSVGALYGDGTPLNIGNWDQIDESLKHAFKDKNHIMNILKNKCHYKAIILDKYENPGYNLDHPEIMAPTFRCDQFLHGYSLEGHDDNMNFPYRTLNFERLPDTLEYYVLAVANKIREKNGNGCVSLKIAIAYERDLYFENVDYQRASVAYKNPEATNADIKAFQDYMMFRLCEIANQNDIPVQIHTGLGKLDRSNAIGLKTLIDCNMDTKFVLFHCGYPWMDDILGLMHNYRNVYPDLCWLPLISTSAAIRFLREALEVGDSNRLCWGCDTWTAQESYGALLAIRHVLSTVLSEMCFEEAISYNQAEHIISSILYENAKKLYKIKM